MATGFRKILEGLRLIPKAASTASEKGDLDVTTSSGKLNYHNGTSASAVVTEDHSATLTNKELTSPVITDPDLDNTGISNVSSISSSNSLLTISSPDQTVSGSDTGSFLIETGEAAIDAGSGAIQVHTGDSVLSSGVISIKTGLSTNSNSGGITLETGGSTNGVTGDVNIITGSSGLGPSSRGDITLDCNQLSISGLQTTAILTDVYIFGQDNSITLGEVSNPQVRIKWDDASTPDQLVIDDNGSTLVPVKLANPVINEHAATKQYVDAINYIQATTSVGLAVGNLVYVDNTGVARKLDATDDTKIEFVGVVSSISGGNAIIQVSGPITITGASFTVGKPVFASAITPGALVQPANTDNGNWVIPVGIAISSNKMVINAAGSSTAVKMQADVDPSIANNTDLIINTIGSNSNVNIGHPVYLDASVFAQLIDAGNDSKIEFIGVSLSNGSGAGSIEVQVSGIVTIPSASFTPGSPVFINPSAIPGGSAASFYTQTIPNSAGQWIIQAGIAIAADKFVINGAGGATAVKITSETDQFIYANVRSVSTTQSLTNGDSIILATAGVSGITLTLPAPTAGKIFNIKKVDSAVGIVTISPSSGTIDGAANKTISIQYASLTITSDGTNFFVI